MAEGGRYERLPQEDPFGWDDDNADQTGAFYPNGASTPAPTMQTEKNGLPELPELPKATEDLLNELPSLSITTDAAKIEIDKEFPYADKSKIKYKNDTKGRTEVGLISPPKNILQIINRNTWKKW